MANRASAVGRDEDALFVKDGIPVKFCFHRSVTQGRSRITRDVEVCPSSHHIVHSLFMSSLHAATRRPNHRPRTPRQRSPRRRTRKPCLTPPPVLLFYRTLPSLALRRIPRVRPSLYSLGNVPSCWAYRTRDAGSRAWGRCKKGVSVSCIS